MTTYTLLKEYEKDFKKNVRINKQVKYNGQVRYYTYKYESSFQPSYNPWICIGKNLKTYEQAFRIGLKHFLKCDREFTNVTLKE